MKLCNKVRDTYLSLQKTGKVENGVQWTLGSQAYGNAREEPLQTSLVPA